MKIAVSATEPNIDANVEPRFGRCPYFVIVDPDTMNFETIENSSRMAAGGAGIASGQTIVDKGVEAVLTGNCGPNAHQVLSAAGIKIITGISGKVRDAVKAYKEGRLKNTDQPTVEAHFGMGDLGYGSGIGGARRGGGRGAGMRTGVTRTGESLQIDHKEELRSLKQQLSVLSEQLSSIRQSIEELEKKE